MVRWPVSSNDVGGVDYSLKNAKIQERMKRGTNNDDDAYNVIALLSDDFLRGVFLDIKLLLSFSRISISRVKLRRERRK